MGLGTIIKFAVLCLVVGLILTSLGMGVEDFWTWVAENAENGGEWALEQGKWALPYILIGAGVLTPVYVVRYLIRRRRKG